MDKVATTVAARWDQLEQDIAGTNSCYRIRLLPVLRKMRQHPRIGQLVPNTSHNMLFLAQTTRDYWSRGLPYLEAIAPDQFRVYGGKYQHVYRMTQDREWRDEGYDVLGVGDADQAVAWLDSALPEPFMPAIDGDIDDLRRLQGIFVLTQDEKELGTAALLGTVPHVDFLLDKGVSANVVDYYGCTPLMHAVMGGCVEAVFASNNTDPEKCVASRQVVTKGHMEVIQLLLAHGAVIDAQSNDGDTAISIAEEQATWPELVEFLRNVFPTR